MKKFLAFFALTILLTGCTAASKIDPTIKEEIPLEIEFVKNDENIEDEIFKKNMECLKLRSTIENRINEKEKKYADLNEEWSLENIFYSPKINSCLYVVYKNHQFENYRDSIYEKWLYDVLDDGPSSKTIDFCFKSIAEIEESGCEEFEQKIEELKQS
ncbi:hypothetical protein KAI54_00390 [Candidatus Gracilibacteria bacterium]|nr:hypothetical protein [Candidatus Gracilibacteria bacterium]